MYLRGLQNVDTPSECALLLERLFSSQRSRLAAHGESPMKIAESRGDERIAITGRWESGVRSIVDRSIIDGAFEAQVFAIPAHAPILRDSSLINSGLTLFRARALQLA